MGDTSDNIPGVPGIGEKTAISLIQEFGSIEEVYNHIDDIPKKGVKEKLIEGKELAFMSKGLATIYRDLDLCCIEDLEVKEPQKEKLKELFQKLEFKTLISKYGLENVNSQAGQGENEALNYSIRTLKGASELEEYISGITEGQNAAIFPLLDKQGHTIILGGIAITVDGTDAVFCPVDDSQDEEKVTAVLKPVLENDNITIITPDICYGIYTRNGF
jgi:DNA polymerase-1